MIFFSEQIKNRVIAKLGGPIVFIELDDSQMNQLFETSIRNWFLYSILSKLEENMLKSIENEWIESYFQALCKESLGRIRSKYNGNLPIPGAEINLEFESLLRESEQEKDGLIGLLVPASQKIVLAIYVNVGNMDGSEIDAYMKKIKNVISDDKSFKYFFIPAINQETRIECIYPNLINDEEIKIKINTCLDDVLKNIKSE